MSTFQKSRRLVNFRGQLKHQGTIKNMYSHTHTFLCHILHLTVCTSVSLSNQTRKSVSGHSHWTNAWPKHNLISVKGISIVQNNLLNLKRLSGHKLWIWLKWLPGHGVTDGLCSQNLNRIPCQSSNLLLRGTIIPVYIIRTNSSSA